MEKKLVIVNGYKNIIKIIWGKRQVNKMIYNIYRITVVLVEATINLIIMTLVFWSLGVFGSNIGILNFDFIWGYPHGAFCALVVSTIIVIIKTNGRAIQIKVEN